MQNERTTSLARRLSRVLGAAFVAGTLLMSTTSAHASNVKTTVKRVHVYEDGTIEVTANNHLCPNENGAEGWGTVRISAPGYDGLLKLLISAQLSRSTVRIATEKRGSDCAITFAALWEGTP